MSDLLSNILEKYKKAGTLDIDRSGANGKENDFIGKHTDNVDVKDAPGKGEQKKIDGQRKSSVSLLKAMNLAKTKICTSQSIMSRSTKLICLKKNLS